MFQKYTQLILADALTRPGYVYLQQKHLKAITVYYLVSFDKMIGARLSVYAGKSTQQVGNLPVYTKWRGKAMKIHKENLFEDNILYFFTSNHHQLTEIIPECVSSFVVLVN
jgi:hypothetical protein